MAFHLKLGTLVTLSWCALANLGRAQQCELEGNPPPPCYQVTLSSALHHASRDDFTRPVFLLQQPPRRIDALQLRTRLALDLELTPTVGLHADLPLVASSVEVELSPLVVSQDQVLPGITRHLSGVGVADPSLAVSYLLLASSPASARAYLGIALPIDDNPGSNTFPQRIPSSTGQTELFARLSPRYEDDHLGLTLGYQLSVYPGSNAAYLVRRIGNQGYTSGGLALHFRHRLQLEVALKAAPWLTVLAAPDWEARDQPRLREPGGERAFLPEERLYELGLRLGLRLSPAAGHQLEVSYREAFLESWQADPFFPIAIPARGASLVWSFWDR